MNPFDNFGMFFQGFQTNNLLANIPSFNIGTDLTAKQPLLTMPNLVNMQAANNGTSAIGSAVDSNNVFDSNQTTNNPVAQFNSMLPQKGAMDNFWSPFSSSNMGGISLLATPNLSSLSGSANTSATFTPNTNGTGQPPTPNLSSLGAAPTSAAPFMISMGIAMGLIDPASVGISATSGTQSAGNQAAAIKKTPIISAGTVEKALNKPVTAGTQYSELTKSSFMTADGSGRTLFNATLRNPEDKAAFINSLSSNIDKEVRLAGKGASKDVVAEVMANEIFNLYAQKNPEAGKNSTYKNKVIAGLKNICMGNVDEKSLQYGINGQINNQAELPEGIAEALAVLPGLNTKDEIPAWVKPIDTFGGGIASGNKGGLWQSLTIKILKETTNDLTATAKENLIKKNS